MGFEVGGLDSAAEGAGAAGAGVAGAPVVCACRTVAARSEAANDSHNDDANVLVFMILGDPKSFVGDRTWISRQPG